MTSTDQVHERFKALLQLVEDVHNKCKEKHPSVEVLVDVFFLCHNLSLAFHKDCENYLDNRPPSEDLLATISKIYAGLMCSMSHVQESANRLNTTVLDKIIEKLQLSADSPDSLEVKPGVN